MGYLTNMARTAGSVWPCLSDDAMNVDQKLRSLVV